VRSGERIAIQGGERRTVRLAARPRLGGLKVNAVDDKGNDVEATVLVEGSPAGEAGTVLKVPACSRAVRVQSAAGSWSGQVQLEEGAVKVVTAKLSSTPATPSTPAETATTGESQFGLRASYLAMPLSTADVSFLRMGMFTWSVDSKEAAHGIYGGLDVDLSFANGGSAVDLYDIGTVVGYAWHLGGTISLDGAVRGALSIPEEDIFLGIGAEAGLSVSLTSNFLVRGHVEALKWSGNVRTIGADYQLVAGIGAAVGF
jgi:hypothetical protein